LRLADLAPTPATLQRLSAYLDDRRMLGTRLVLEPARYRGVTVVARVRAKRQVSAERLSAELVAALHRYLHPVVGGPDGTGWPFGRPVHQGEVYAVFQRVAGVDYVEQVRLFAVDLRAERPTDELERVVPEPTELIFSFRPDVFVEEAT
jgi:predicted phage baseplate assembly protein